MNIIDEHDLIKKLNDDIREIEYLIKNEDKINKKNKIIKNLKITKNISILLLPYIVVPMISYGISVNCNYSPLIYEKKKENLKIIKIIDNNGNITKYNQYEKYNDVYNVIYYYDKWYQNNNGEYERIIKKYTFDSYKIINEFINKNNDEILEIINDKNFLENDYIINYYPDIIEVQKNISDEQINELPYLKIVLYYENTNQYIIRNQTIEENLIDSIKYLLFTTVLEIVVSLLEKKLREKIHKENQEYQQEYFPLDIETLQKKLYIRKNNLNKLME